MGGLVALYQGKEPRISTDLLFLKFGYATHRALKKVIWTNTKKLEERGALIKSSEKNTNAGKGRPEESYLLNERQFNYLAMLVKNTPESLDIKDKIEVEFYKMQVQLANLAKTRLSTDWQQVRQDGKAVYHQKTDIIKTFVEYATEQGSQSAKMYYTNLATMENKALFLVEQKYSNLREVLNIKQLMQVATADQVVEKALQDGMDKKLSYKEIYQLAKERIIQFSNIIGKSQVIALLEKDNQVSLEDL